MGKKIVLVTILGLLLRIINLNQSFWLDEAAQLVMSQNSLEWIWFGRGGDFHPPLFYFLTHFWLQISHSEVVLRVLPLLPGILAIPAIYLLTAKLFSKNIGLYAALFVAINPYLVYFSQELRSYSLMLLLSIISMYFLVSRQWLWLTVVNTLLVYTHYSSFLFIFAQLIYILFYFKNIIPYLYSLLSSLLLYTPWLPQFFHQLTSGINIDTYLPGWRAELTLPLFKSLPLILFKFTAGRIDLLSDIVYLVYIVFVIGCLFFILYLAKKLVPVLTFWLVLPIFISLVLSFIIPQTQPFRLIFCLPPLLIYFALAADRHPKKVFTLLFYIFIVGNFMQITRPRLQREHWRQATEYLNTQNLPVIIKFPDKFAPLYWYNLTPPAISAYPKFAVPANPAVMVMEYLSDLTDPRRTIESQLLSSGYREISAKDFPGVGIIRKYVKPAI